jgi:type II secretory pathway component PulF
MKINIKNILRNKSVKLNLKEKIDFLEQLSNLLSSGIPIINSFTIMNYQTKNKRVKFLIEDTLNKLNV